MTKHVRLPSEIPHFDNKRDNPIFFLNCAMYNAKLIIPRIGRSYQISCLNRWEPRVYRVTRSVGSDRNLGRLTSSSVRPSLVLTLIPSASIGLHLALPTTFYCMCIWICSLMPRRERTWPGARRPQRWISLQSLSGTRAYPRYQDGLRDDSDIGKDGRYGLSR